MKRKKAWIFLVAALIVLLATFIWKKEFAKETLEVPEYPLKTEIVLAVLDDYDWSCNVEEHSKTDWSDSFSLRGDDDTLYGSIKSQLLEDQRTLGIGFFTFDEDSDFTEEECRSIIQIATRLFGGFENENQVYDRFMKEFDPDDSLSWEGQVEGIDCEIKFVKFYENYMMEVGFIEKRD